MKITKFEPAWQVVRAKVRLIKNPQEKISYVKSFMASHPNVHNRERILNWLKMTKVAYKDAGIQSKFDKAIEWMESLENLSLEDNGVSLQDISTEDLELIYKDLSKRKYGFQFKSVPKEHIEFMQKLVDERSRRGLD